MNSYGKAEGVIYKEHNGKEKYNRMGQQNIATHKLQEHPIS